MYNFIQYDTYQVGSERRCHLLPFQLLEIDIFEERLVCNIPFWASSQAKTSRRVLFQQLPNKREEGFRTVLHIQHFLCNISFRQAFFIAYQLNQVFGFFSKEFGEKYSFITNGPEQLIFITTIEWGLAQEHFIEQYSK